MNTHKSETVPDKNQTRKLQGRSENEARNETAIRNTGPEQTGIRNTGAGTQLESATKKKLEPGTILESAKLEPEQYWNPQNWSPEQNRNGFLKAERQLAVFFSRKHIRADKLICGDFPKIQSRLRTPNL
ncbi:hypothetical protein TNCT_679161 [Trichonephila clavata]|uniref:Uncharacterized protein n=1 Tax=Trichonephila clavata TaxID=2740835 RepID=A0A8X6KN48_TRICU|nr:hypothetical protein TNCT_679161 [Trichonephila clavata]